MRSDESLQDVSHRLDRSIVDWGVTVERISETPTSLLAYGHRNRRAVLVKVVKTPGGEWRSGELLRLFGGRGTVQVYEYADGAMLLDQVRPGDPLTGLSLRDDDAATSILADTIAAMAPSGCPEWVPRATDWGRSFLSHRQRNDATVPADLVASAERIFFDLCDSQQSERLLHGDLHHGNVLFDRERGWLAIDPKGVRGELEYEIGAALRNPCDRPGLFAQPDVIRRRADRFARAVAVDPARVLRWAFAQAVLAAIWQIEDGAPVEPDGRWLAFARAIGTLCER
jgi:streptomycin 6-kinase